MNKTIEERAEEYATRGGVNALLIKESFEEGAKSEHEELTRWNSPEIHPKRGISVLVKCNAYPGIQYIVGYWCGVCFYNSLNDRKINNIIGWREIHE